MSLLSRSAALVLIEAVIRRMQDARKCVLHSYRRSMAVIRHSGVARLQVLADALKGSPGEVACG